MLMLTICYVGKIPQVCFKKIFVFACCHIVVVKCDVAQAPYDDDVIMKHRSATLPRQPGGSIVSSFNKTNIITSHNHM